MAAGGETGVDPSGHRNRVSTDLRPGGAVVGGVARERVAAAHQLKPVRCGHEWTQGTYGTAAARPPALEHHTLGPRDRGHRLARTRGERLADHDAGLRPGVGAGLA